jgi:hypothetical protein
MFRGQILRHARLLKTGAQIGFAATAPDRPPSPFFPRAAANGAKVATQIKQSARS